jgi:hypothetical protein
MDRGQVGHVRQESQGEVLLHYKGWSKQLAQDAAYWQRLAGVMGRVLALQGQEGEK